MVYIYLQQMLIELHLVEISMDICLAQELPFTP